MLSFAFTLVLAGIAAAKGPGCKATPLDGNWPSLSDWAALNASIGGVLVEIKPAASSCYPGNPLGSSLSCTDVDKIWSHFDFQKTIPDGMNEPTWSNNSCLPPSSNMYTSGKGCSIGGVSPYVVNATSEEQISIAMKWASGRNIRIVIKGTGHEISGRSNGAYSLLIWTRNFNSLKADPAWSLPGSTTGETENVLIAGSGNVWGHALTYALSFGRVVVSGADQSVGLGGHMQGGGGHGPFSSTYGLAADQILQVRVVTPAGRILVADATQNRDIFWAVRGGGAGQYWVVTEFVLRTHPAPSSVASAVIYMAIPGTNGTKPDPVVADASWYAAASLLHDMPDLMELGLTGGGIIFGQEKELGANLAINIVAYNSTTDELAKTLGPVLLRMNPANKSLVTVGLVNEVNYISFGDYFVNTQNNNNEYGAADRFAYLSSRLLGRKQLSDLPISDIASWLQRLTEATTEYEIPSQVIIQMSGGPGTRNVPSQMQGAANPVWRETYLHTILWAADLSKTKDMLPQDSINAAADFTEEHIETVWRQWAPETGAYMNEANALDSEFKHSFYGTNYDRLVEIKRKFDPHHSLFVLSGVDSDGWTYDLTSGRLCYEEK
ncbi:putative isoamyl alcohol oxidase [Thozetella sp. PMI_491]|nr:putative isoamyl alcohol oxidase [Thozetella sp. PMI_491]